MNKKTVFGIFILTAILIGISIFSLCVGSSGIPLKRILWVIFKGKGSYEYSILFDIRMPRIILGFAAGGILSLSGVILQGMFRNPLVEPYTLGISGGAALGISLVIALKLTWILGALTLPFAGFLGAVLVLLFIYFFAVKKEIVNTQSLLLTGVMVSFVASSLIMLIMAVCRAEDLHGIIFWIMGSLEEPDWMLIKILLIVSILGLGVSYLFATHLNAFALGEDEAQHLGINVQLTKKLLFLLASLLVGCCVALVGIIGFVGLVIPHFVRIFFSNDHKFLLIGSFLTGASFLILSDTLARTVISSIELPVGVITGILGGSLFIYMLMKKQLSGFRRS